ncbi:ATP-binding protein [Parasphaerochaeta coccoides]|uniref:Magnesium chelatase ChlI subunit n=1 Tax=Parasphaerochaeta coccoides (strain ATCC BAA-1237 / DSM 17374 / SPN1) TaxID=760011 RepID=F4GKX9_PARC1|nr:ATP-binding protein [Parasphaerochaeta coccoides]AEC01892.1 magnesium chelatase ChlI subunit [Parasphaerochaeta coccoides DSM 17374]
MLIFSHLAQGYRGICIQIEADVRNGFPGFDIVGLPDSTIREARERIRSAIRNSGFKFPAQRILVNLAPAHIPKTGTELDAAIAVAILLAGIHVLSLPAAPLMITGELALDGHIRGNMSLSAVESARLVGCRTILSPESHLASLSYNEQNEHHSPENHQDTIVVHPVRTLKEAFQAAQEHIKNHKSIITSVKKDNESYPLPPLSPFQGITGMKEARRALEIAAAGRHDVLLFGPSGSGKTMIASRFIQLIPPLGSMEAKERLLVWESCRNRQEAQEGIGTILPHDCTSRQVLGSIRTASPGQGALHHGSVLFLDEITAYAPKVLETIKEIHDEGKTILQMNDGRHIVYPSVFQVIATMNACPCGRLGMEKNSCLCSDKEIRHFWKKVPAPILDRFDIRLPIIPEDFSVPLETSQDDELPARITNAVCRQDERFAESPQHYHRNGDIVRGPALDFFPKLPEILKLLRSFPATASFSVRGLLCTAAVARTIADLDDSDSIRACHMEEAIGMRKFAGTDIFWRNL